MTPEARPASLRRNAIANMAGRGVSALLWLAVTPFALGRLGPERFGVWSLFFVFGGYVATLDLGMSQGVSRYVAVGAARGDRAMVLGVLRRSLWVGGAIGLLWCLAFEVFRGLFLTAFHVPAPLAPEVARSLAVFALSMLVFMVAQVLHGALQGAQRLDLSNLYLLAGLGLHVTILVVGLAHGAGLMAAAVAMVAGHTLSGTLAAVSLRRVLGRIPRATEGGDVGWRELLRFSGVVQATNAFTVGWLQVSKVLLGILGQVVWVTTFELGFRVAFAVLSVPQLIQGAVIPAAASASASADGAPVRAVYAWACRWVFAVGGMMLAGLWLTAPALMTAWLGPGHGDSAAVAQVLAVTLLCVIVPGPATAVARGAGAPGLEATMYGVAFALDVLLCLWLVPRAGPPGAAWATGLSVAAAGAWMVTALHRRLGVATGEWMVHTMAARVLGPLFVAALVAVGLAALGFGGTPAGRGAAFGVLALEAAAFLPLAILVTWPTGDARLALGHVRAWLARRGSVAGTAGGVS